METNIVREFDKKISDETIVNINRKKTYNDILDELEEENENLASNMPWNTTEQATEITISDAAKYSKNKLELFGNTEQAQYTGKNLIDYSALNKYNRDVSSAPSVGSPLRYYNNSKAIQFDVPVTALRGKNIYISFNLQNTSSRQFALDANKNYIETFENGGLIKDSYSYIAVIINSNIDIPISTNIRIMIEQGSTATDYEPYTGGQPSPNPDYPQDIHVVTGNNTIVRQGKNLLPGEVYEYCNFLIDGRKIFDNTRACSNFIAIDETQTYFFSAKMNFGFFGIAQYDINYNFISRRIWQAISSHILTNFPSGTKYIKFFAQVQQQPATQNQFARFNTQIEKGSTATSYVPHYHADYPINLGNIELCKIGDYQDYLYKENGNWYKYEITSKIVFNGSENWKLYSSERPGRFCIQNFFGGTYPPVESFCDKFSQENYTNYSNIQNNHYSIQTPNQTLWFVHTDTETLAEWKEWLSNNNVLLRYLKANPESKVTRTQITDETLIAQLDEIYEHLKLVKGTNNITVTAEDLAPYMQLTYMQDLPSKLDKLEAMIIENS